MNEQQKNIQDKCIAFAVKVDRLKKQLQREQHEYNKSDQIDRSSSSIGAMYSEAIYAESDTDYIHKLAIAQKECSETKYWLQVLIQCEYISKEQYSDIMHDCEELMRILTSIIVALKRRHNSARRAE